MPPREGIKENIAPNHIEGEPSSATPQLPATENLYTVDKSARKQEIMEEMAEQVIIVKEIMSIIGEAKPEDRSEILRRLQAYRAGLLRQVTAKNFRSFRFHQNRKHSLLDGTDLTSDQDKNESLSAKTEPRRTTATLTHIIQGLANLLDQIERNSTSPDTARIIEAAQAKFEVEMEAKDIMSIEPGLLAPIVVIPEQYWASSRNYKTAAGMYSYQSGIIFIRSTCNDEATLKHEINHAIAGNFANHLDQASGPKPVLEKWFEGIRKSKLDEAKITALSERLSSQPYAASLLDLIHEEILAEYYNAVTLGQLDSLRDQPFTPENYDLYINALRTAALQIKDTLAYIEQEKTNLPEITPALATLQSNLTYRFERMVKQLIEASELVHDDDADAAQELWAALITLKPSEYRHLKSYLTEYFKT